MTKIQAASLLRDVKNYLDITWDDPDGDKKLDGIIRRGAAYIQRLTVRRLTFGEGTYERSLLFDYCRYARSGVTSEFSKNYLTDLNTFRQDEAVKEKELGDTK